MCSPPRHPCHSPASPAAAGNCSGGSGRRRRKAAAALGSHGALQHVWMPGLQGCSQTAANPSPAAPTPPRSLPSTRSPHGCHAPTMANANPTPPVPGGFHPFSPHSPVPLTAASVLVSPRQRQRSPLPPAEPGAVGLPAPQRKFNCNHHIRLPHPRPLGPPAPMALAAHIWKSFSRALQKALIKARSAAASVANLTLSVTPPRSCLPPVRQNRPHPAPRSHRHGSEFG